MERIPQSLFWTKIRNISIPCKPQTNYMKVLICKRDFARTLSQLDSNLHVPTHVVNFNNLIFYHCLYMYTFVIFVSIGPFCGKTVPAAFTIPTPNAAVEFHSDSSDGYSGFKLTYTCSNYLTYNTLSLNTKNVGHI